MSRSTTIEKIRKICLSLEGADEAAPFGHPWFRVKEKVFTTAFDENGVVGMTVKCGLEDMGIFLEDPRFTKAQYVGRFGWVTMRLTGKIDWEEIEELIKDSYRRVSAGQKKSGRASGGRPKVSRRARPRSANR